MAQSVSERQNRHLVFLEVVLRQSYLTVEDRDEVLCFQLLRRRFGSVTLEAEGVAIGPQQMVVASAVWRVASRAALHKSGLVVHGFLREIGNFTVAAEADVHRIRLG